MLNEHEIESITAKVNEFKKSLNISKYPISAIDIIQTHFQNKIIPCSLPINSEGSDVDIVINYDEQSQKYVMVVNQDRITPTLLKRLNFSLAHELAHVVLNHHEIKKKIDTYDWENYGSEDDENGGLVEYYSIVRPTFMDEEANEFAGQLLVSDKIIKQYGIRNAEYLSDYFFVSQSVIKVRFDILNRQMPYKGLSKAEYTRMNRFQKKYYESVLKITGASDNAAIYQLCKRCGNWFLPNNNKEKYCKSCLKYSNPYIKGKRLKRPCVKIT